MHCSKERQGNLEFFDSVLRRGLGPACCRASLQGKCEVFLLPGTLAHDQVHHVLFEMSHCTWGQVVHLARARAVQDVALHMEGGGCTVPVTGLESQDPFLPLT